ncbi:hypothetical protein Tco_1485848 [Tanacetum coccineum]
MANLPPPDHVADLLEDEPVQPEPALIILHHAPAQPEGYVGDDDMEDDKEENPDEDPKEEPIEQVVPEPNNMDGFASHPLPQLEGNMNGWLIEDDVDEELEEDGVDDDYDEEMEMDEDDKDNGRNDNEDDAEVINAYEEVDPLNRPPPTSDEETEFAPPVVPIVDVNNEPVTHWASCTLVNGCNLGSIHRVVTRLDKQMFDSYKTEKKMAKKFKEDEFRMNRHEYDITDLDMAVRKNSSDHSEMKKFILGLSRQINELRFQQEPLIHSVSALRVDDPYAMVRDAAMATREDNDDDTTTTRDP